METEESTETEHKLNLFLLTQRNAEELSSYQRKIIGIDSHLSIAIAGLSSDARVLSNYMKQEALASKITYGRAIPPSHIVSQIASRAQSNTQHYGKRPYGVGLLVAGVDGQGPHLYEFQPSGITLEMTACAIGARSQMARTYLERHLAAFEDCSREELICHGVKALQESLAQDKELTMENTSIGVVGRDASTDKLDSFKLYEGAEAMAYLDQANATQNEEQGGGEAQQGQGDAMELDS